MALQSNEQSNTITKHTQEIHFGMVAVIIILELFKNNQNCQNKPRLHYLHCTMQCFMHCSPFISRLSAPTGRGYKKSSTTYAEWIEKPITFLWSHLRQGSMPVSLSHTMCIAGHTITLLPAVIHSITAMLITYSFSFMPLAPHK